MRKILAALAAVFLFTAVSIAQDAKQKTTFGFKAGINLSTFRTAVDYSTFDPNVKAGFALGAFVDIPVSKTFSVQPEFLYSQMGAKAFDDFWGKKTFRYNYFSVPLLVKWNAFKNLRIVAGPQADFLIRATEEDDMDHKEEISYDVKDFDFGFTAGFETSFSPNLVVGARYIHGSQDVSNTTDENSLFNQGIQVHVGWKLLKVKKAKKVKTN